MAIRPSLNHRLPMKPAETASAQSSPLPAAVSEARVKARSTVEGYRPPSRIGKRAAVAWLEPEAIDQLNIEAIRRKRNLQDILVEAINDWFAKEGLPRFDAER